MARYFGNTRIVYSGNVEVARQYVSEARKYLGELVRNSPSTLDSNVREVTNDSGVHFRVGWYGPLKFIQIDAAGAVGRKSKQLRLLLGFFAAPKTELSLTGYSTEPYVILEPREGVDAPWVSWFKTPLNTEPTYLTHPTDDYNEPLKFYKNALGTTVAASADAAKSAVNTGRSQYWQNAKKDLVVQYSGQPPIAESFLSNDGCVAINGRFVLTNAALYNTVGSLYPGQWVYFYAAAAKRTVTGLDLYIAVKTAVSTLSTRTLRIFKIPLAPTPEEQARLTKYKTSVENAFGYAGQYTAVASGADIEELYAFTIPGTPAYGGSNGAFNPEVTEFTVFSWREENDGVYIDELVTDFTDLENTETVTLRSSGPLFTAISRSTAVASVIAMDFTVGTRYTPGSSVKTDTEEGPLQNYWDYPCYVDYLPSGKKTYGYLLCGYKTDTHVYDNTYSTTGTIANNVDCATNSFYTKTETENWSSAALWIPKLDENEDETLDTWCVLGAKEFSRTLSAFGSTAYTAVDTGDPGHTNSSNAWTKTLSGNNTSNSEQTTLEKRLLWVDLKTRSAAEVWAVSSISNNLDVSFGLGAPGAYANSAIAPFNMFGHANNADTISERIRFWHKETIVLDTGDIVKQYTASSPTIDTTSYVACTEVAVNSGVSSIPQASSSSSSTTYYEIGDNFQIAQGASGGYSMGMAAKKESYIITGFAPSPGSMSLKVPIAQASNYGIPEGDVDYMLGAHEAEAYAPLYMLSAVLISTTE